AATQREAGDRRDHRLAAAGDAIPVADEVLAVDLHVGLRLHLLDVGTGGEGLHRAGDHDAADRGVRLAGIERLIELGYQRIIECVERLGSIEGDETDLAPDLDENVLVSHWWFRVLEAPN